MLHKSEKSQGYCDKLLAFLDFLRCFLKVERNGWGVLLCEYTDRRNCLSRTGVRKLCPKGQNLPTMHLGNKASLDNNPIYSFKYCPWLLSGHTDIVKWVQEKLYGTKAENIYHVALEETKFADSSCNRKWGALTKRQPGPLNSLGKKMNSYKRRCLSNTEVLQKAEKLWFTYWIAFGMAKEDQKFPQLTTLIKYEKCESSGRYCFLTCLLFTVFYLLSYSCCHEKEKQI